MKVRNQGRGVTLPAALVLFIAVFLLGSPAGAWEGDKRYEIYGYIESDLRLTLPIKDAGGMEDYNFVRSDNTFRLKGSLNIAKNVKASADFKLILTGMMAGNTLEELSYREKIDPFRIENDALYLQVINFLLPGLDFRIGRQIVVWGTADKFNPTSCLNSLDLEDPLKFGEYIANEMINITYSPPALAAHGDSPMEDLTVQFIVVPYFRPAQLPFWTQQAFTNPDLFKQRVHADEMIDLIDTQQLFIDGGGSIEHDVRVNRPDFSIKNVQVGAKLEWTLWGVDMSVSYYRGFYGIPVAERVYAEDIHLRSWPGGTSTSLEELIRSTDVSGSKILTHTMVGYPRMQVFGADFSSSIEKLGGLGFWGEVAFYLHPPVYYHLRTSDAWAPGLGGTEIRIPVGRDHLVEDIEGNWFFKLTAGIDYTIFSWWYINIQYLHGFVDEFGMNDLGDYIVAGSDFKFFEDRLLFRLFAVIEISPVLEWTEKDGLWGLDSKEGGHYSAMLYPELTLSFWRAVDISIGGLFGLGDSDTAYGSPLSGPSMVFMRGRVSI